MNLIGFDFSINKPAACVFVDNEYEFYGWPYKPQKKLPALFKSAGVNILERTDDKIKGDDASAKMRYEVKNARYISEVIFNELKPFLNNDTYIAFEGMSYGSSGDVVLQLGGYKYMIMDIFSELVPLENMFTYAPTTVKKTAGCSKRGLGKHAMIDAFMTISKPNSLKTALRADKTAFMKKGFINYVDHLDDLVDAYFVLETLREKEGL
jgi:hypothetical protein